MKGKQLGLLLIAATWIVIIGLVIAPWPLKVLIGFSALFAGNIAFFRGAYLMSWRKSFNDCALGWLTIGMFILAIAHLN